MDFALIIVFIALYYIRPQEWIAILEPLRPVLIVFIGAIVATAFRKPGFSPKDLLKTPHDWFMLAFLFWIAFATASNGGYWMDIPDIFIRTGAILWGLKNKFGFYFIVMLALYNRNRVERFLWYWLGLIFLLAALALLSEFGIDPMGSYAVTHSWRFDGRLVLNNSMFNNPNELGHTIIPLIPLIYLLCVWKRSPLVKQVALALMFIPLYCVFLTRSKGSAISGALTGLVAFGFGRPKVVQIGIIVFAMTAGVAGLKLMPRMSDLKSPRAEEGIRGRLSVFAFGYDACWNNELLGYGNFNKRYEAVYGYPKSSHSSYNSVGAELGVIGLTIYLAIFYCCLRTLLTAKTRNLSEERIRRVLIGAIVSFMASSWMVGFAYHSTFFFLVASISAFHRLLLKPAEDEAVKLDEDGEPYSPIIKPDQMQSPPMSATEGINPKDAETNISEKSDKPSALTWNRFRVFDLACTLFLLLLTKKIWAYFLFTWGS